MPFVCNKFTFDDLAPGDLIYIQLMLRLLTEALLRSAPPAVDIQMEFPLGSRVLLIRRI